MSIYNNGAKCIIRNRKTLGAYCQEPTIKVYIYWLDFHHARIGLFTKQAHCRQYKLMIVFYIDNTFTECLKENIYLIEIYSGPFFYFTLENLAATNPYCRKRQTYPN